MFIAGLPTWDIVQMVLGGLQLASSVLQSLWMIWFIKGGWKNILRTFEFDIDKYIVKYIGAFYDYFREMITLDLFNQDIINELTGKIYIFIGVIMFFRLAMVVLKYLVNPDLTSDAKAGVDSLIKRVMLGAVGILLLPIIFNFALEIQRAIFSDSIIQKLVVPNKYIEKVNKLEKDGGKCLATYVWAGFITPRDNATTQEVNRYKQGIKTCDLTIIDGDLNEWVISITEPIESSYHFDYVYILSTIALADLLLLMAQYCIDIVTRCLRMLLYKVLAPVAMIEYMISGAENGVFKKWKDAILSTYIMIFMRVMSLWIVLFVFALMQEPSGSDVVKDTLLQNDDYLLRALIIIAVLGFMKDVPKLIGSLFGLDFEQQGHASEMLKSVASTVKGGVSTALGMGGAAVAGLGAAAINSGQMAVQAGARLSTQKSLNNQWVSSGGKKGLNPADNKSFGELFSSAWNDPKSGMAARMSQTGKAQRKTIFGSTPFAKDIYAGASGAYSAGYVGSGASSGIQSAEDYSKKKDAERKEEARHAADSAALQSMESALWGGNRKKSDKGPVDGVVDAGENTNGVLAKQSIAIGNDIAFKAGGEVVHADGSHALDVSVADSDLQANRNIRTAVNNQYSITNGGELRDAGGIDGLQPVQSTTIDTQDSVLAHHRTVRNIESETVGGDVVDISTGAVTGNIDRSESIAGKIDTDVNLQRNMNAHVMGGDTVDVSTGAVTGNIDKKESISGQIQTDVNLQRNLNAHVMGGDTVDVDTGAVTGSVDQENSIEGRLNTNVNIAHNINSTLSGGTKVDETTGEETGEEVSEDQSISKNIRKAVNVATNISSKLTGGETVDEDTGEANGNIEEEDSIAGKIDAKNDSEDE